MEAELLTVLGHIPAPDDRDLATQLNSTQRSEVTATSRSIPRVPGKHSNYVIGVVSNVSCHRSKSQELKACDERYQRGRFELSRLQTQLEEAE